MKSLACKYATVAAGRFIASARRFSSHAPSSLAPSRLGARSGARRRADRRLRHHPRHRHDRRRAVHAIRQHDYWRPRHATRRNGRLPLRADGEARRHAGDTRRHTETRGWQPDRHWLRVRRSIVHGRYVLDGNGHSRYGDTSQLHGAARFRPPLPRAQRRAHSVDGAVRGAARVPPLRS